MYHISYIVYYMSYALFHVSYIIFNVSYIIYHISYIIYHVSYIMYHVSYIIYHVLYRTKARIPMAWHWTEEYHRKALIYSRGLSSSWRRIRRPEDLRPLLRKATVLGRPWDLGWLDGHDGDSIYIYVYIYVYVYVYIYVYIYVYDSLMTIGYI